jgi:hypothetical protein
MGNPKTELTLRFPENLKSLTFNIKSENKLSSLAKLILQGMQFKHFYYARDDIFYLLNSNPSEQEFLLQALYSMSISLQNNLSVDFFDIWISEVYINKVPLKNKFIIKPYQKLESKEYITITLAYVIKKVSTKKKFVY